MSICEDCGHTWNSDEWGDCPMCSGLPEPDPDDDEHALVGAELDRIERERKAKVEREKGRGLWSKLPRLANPLRPYQAPRYVVAANTVEIRHFPKGDEHKLRRWV